MFKSLVFVSFMAALVCGIPKADKNQAKLDLFTQYGGQQPPFLPFGVKKSPAAYSSGECAALTDNASANLAVWDWRNNVCNILDTAKMDIVANQYRKNSPGTKFEVKYSLRDYTKVAPVNIAVTPPNEMVKNCDIADNGLSSGFTNPMVYWCINFIPANGSIMLVRKGRIVS